MIEDKDSIVGVKRTRPRIISMEEVSQSWGHRQPNLVRVISIYKNKAAERCICDTSEAVIKHLRHLSRVYRSACHTGGSKVEVTVLVPRHPVLHASSPRSAILAYIGRLSVTI